MESSSKKQLSPIEDSVANSMIVLGVPISLVNLQTASASIVSWASPGPVRRVFVRDIHGLMRAVDIPALAQLHKEADLVVPDGAPLTWIGRLRGYGPKIGRTPGPDLFELICKVTSTTGHRHYFFGGKEGVSELMIRNLISKYPGLAVCGQFSPPMREVSLDQPFTPEEMLEIKAISQCNPDFIWVGLSTPKQEFWISKASEHLQHGVLLGIGAAFDFHAGTVARAPKWMRNNGLEWLHRLISEPRRLWKRYLILAPRFVLLFLTHEILRKLRRISS